MASTAPENPSRPLPPGFGGAPGAVPDTAVDTRDLTDRDLVLRVARKDEHSARALELLFGRHAQALQRFIARALRNDLEAEDLVHDAFVRVAEKAGTFRGESPFRTWLFSMALNLVRSKQRRVALKKKADETLVMRRPELAAPKPESDPAWDAERRELWEKVEQAMEKLPETERETFQLYWFGKLPYAEISQLTGVSVSAAKVRVHRVLSRLSEMLGGIRK